LGASPLWKFPDNDAHPADRCRGEQDHAAARIWHLWEHEARLDELGAVVSTRLKAWCRVTHSPPFQADVVLTARQVPKAPAGRPGSASWAARATDVRSWSGAPSEDGR